jgi:hypothetical protein
MNNARTNKDAGMVQLTFYLVRVLVEKLRVLGQMSFRKIIKHRVHTVRESADATQ